MPHPRHITMHHVCPSSRGGTSNRDNLIPLRNNAHVAFHAIFDNRTFPEQVRRLINLSGEALTTDATIAIRDAISESDLAYWYKRQCIIQR